MEKILRIGKPYIVELEKKTRLCSDITSELGTRTLYYEVNKEYGHYFDSSRCDAFLVGLINSCMYNNEQIVCEGPVTDELLFQITTYYIPVIADSFSNMNNICVDASTIAPLASNSSGVGTGNSGGVDSTYTMLKYSNMPIAAFNLTHVLFTNISTNDFDDERIRALFERDIPTKEEASVFLNLKFVALYTNLYSFYKQPGIFNHYFAQQYCSAPIALAKLFKVYYFSSTWTPREFSMDEKSIVSSARYDLFSLETLSTSNLSFYSAGTEVGRERKLDYIVNNPYTKKYLQVCSIEQSAGGNYKAAKLNCGYCNKCGRTIIQLYARKILDNYEEIFDTSYFYKNKAKFIGRILAADQKQFAKQAKKELKKNKLYPGLTGFYHSMYRLRYKLAKNKFLVRLYHRGKKNV